MNVRIAMCFTHVILSKYFQYLDSPEQILNQKIENPHQTAPIRKLICGSVGSMCNNLSFQHLCSIIPRLVPVSSDFFLI